MRLNPSQLTVSQSRDPRLLVLAGAGTGKTATSVHWVAGLIREGIRRHQVLMITFTRKAAREMATRIEHLIRDVPKQNAHDALSVGTYHAIASTLIRKEATAFELAHKAFTTIDESEAKSIWKSAMKQASIAPKSTLFAPDKVHQIYSMARNTCCPVEELLQPVFKGNTKRLVRVIGLYEELKKAANVVDYDDLIVLWLKRMQQDPSYAESLRARWPYVLVDEMQDNNRLNESILQTLNPKHLMGVGDANQSVYGFRGSDVQIISEFPSKNPGTRVLKLEHNYRSGQNILDLANRIVATTACPLQLQSHHPEPGIVEYRTYVNPQQEAYAIAQTIQQWAESGKNPSQFAILSRSSRFLTPLEVALNSRRIFYKKYGGQMLADAAEVKDFLCFLRIAHNPLDKIALLRALIQFPGIGEGTAAKAIAAHQGGDFENGEWPEAAAELPLWIKEIRSRKKIADAGNYLYEKIHPLIAANYPKDGDERINTVHAMVQSMAGTPDTPLADFLDGFALSRSGDDYHPDHAVVLSTVHSSKGLEWESVWLIGAGATQIPHPRTIDDKAGKEEELRLFYVAVTRAKRHLILSYPGLNDRKMCQGPTPFLPESTSWRYME